MGENFLRKQKERFEHGSDLAFRSFVEPNLLSKIAELQSRFFTCAARDPKNLPAPGQSVLVLRTPTSLVVVAANVAVGEIGAAEASSLGNLLQTDTACGGMVHAIVADQVPLTGEFTIRVAEVEQ